MSLLAETLPAWFFPAVLVGKAPAGSLQFGFYPEPFSHQSGAVPALSGAAGARLGGKSSKDETLEPPEKSCAALVYQHNF